MKEVKTKFCKIIYQEDLIRIHFYKGFEIDVEQAKEYSDIVEELTAGRPFASLSFAESGVSWTIGARKYLASREPIQYAAAMVAQTPVLRVIANFFMLVSKPKYPTKFFDKIEQGEEWIAKMKQKFYSENPQHQLSASPLQA